MATVSKTMIDFKKTTFPKLFVVLLIVHFVPAEELGGDLCSSAANCAKNYVCITGTCQTCKEAVKSGDYPMECGLHPSIIVVFVIFGVIFWINVFACCWLCDCCPLFKCRMARKKDKGVEAGTVTVSGAFAGVGARAGPKAGSGRGLGDKAKSASKLNLSISPSNASQKLESKPEPTPATAAAHLTTNPKQKKKKKLNSTPTHPPTPPTTV